MQNDLSACIFTYLTPLTSEKHSRLHHCLFHMLLPSKYHLYLKINKQLPPPSKIKQTTQMQPHHPPTPKAHTHTQKLQQQQHTRQHVWCNIISSVSLHTWLWCMVPVLSQQQQQQQNDPILFTHQIDIYIFLFFSQLDAHITSLHQTCVWL